MQDLTSGANNNNQLFSTLKAFNENYYVISGRGVIGGNVSISTFVFLSDVFTFYVNNPLNIQTLIVGWDNVSKKMYALNTDGTYSEQQTNSDFNNNSNAVISLLGNVFNQNTGKDNPLFEFRLYNKTFTLTEMQELQIELNNKYTKLGNELVVNGEFNDGLNNWDDIDNSLSLNLGGCKITKTTPNARISQNNVFNGNKNYKITYDILEKNNNNSISIYNWIVLMRIIPNSLGLNEYILTFQSSTGNTRFYIKR